MTAIPIIAAILIKEFGAGADKAMDTATLIVSVYESERRKAFEEQAKVELIYLGQEYRGG